MRNDQSERIWGFEDSTDLVFNASMKPGKENGYLTMGKKRMFDKSNYGSNFFFQPEGIVELGYDYYGNVTNPEGKGVTVVANTAMVAKQFSIRGVRIDTEVENDEEQKNRRTLITLCLVNTQALLGLVTISFILVLVMTWSRLLEYHVLVGTVFQEHLVKESIHCHFKA